MFYSTKENLFLIKLTSFSTVWRYLSTLKNFHENDENRMRVFSKCLTRQKLACWLFRKIFSYFQFALIVSVLGNGQLCQRQRKECSLEKKVRRNLYERVDKQNTVCDFLFNCRSHAFSIQTCYVIHSNINRKSVVEFNCKSKRKKNRTGIRANIERVRFLNTSMYGPFQNEWIEIENSSWIN